VQGPPPGIGAHNVDALRDWGIGGIDELKRKGVI
jgi:hypothetical protein